MKHRQLGLPVSVIAVALALLVLTWAAVVNQTRVDREQSMRAETERITNLAIAFEQYTIRTLETADSIIRAVIHEFGLAGASLDLQHLIRDLGVNRGVFDAISMVDASGDVIPGATLPQLDAPINLADREHFYVHRDTDTGAVFIGKPVLSRRTQKMMVPVTRRGNTPAGQFAGVVSVQFDPARFTEFYGGATMQARDVLSLVGRDGITRARRVGPRTSTGEDINGSVFMAEAAVRPVGTFVGPGRLDGVERVYSYRSLQGYPLIAAVGVAVEDILVAAKARETWYWQSASAVSVGIVVSSGLLLLTLRRRRQTFDQLLASTMRLQALFDHSIDAIILADNNARCLDINPAACALLGYNREEAIGLAIRDVTALWNEDEARQEWRAFLHAGHASGEYQLRRKDGSQADVEFSAVANIEPDVHLTVLRDVTERKALERHSFRAQRMESLGTLAGGIAHDLNNALAPILMSIELLRDKGDPDRQEVLDTIERSAQRGADMVRQVLSFARGVEGQRVDVSIAALVRDIEKIANDTFLKHLQVRVEVAPDLWIVRGDPTQIHQVLLNLCVNARDAMPTGGTLTLDAENKDLDERFAAQCPEAIPGAYVCITVADTGSGIPPSVLDRIFEPFFTTKSFGQGTGLGLSTSLAIIKSHGGFIRVQTSPAEGTRFHIYLPAVRAAAAAAHQSPATSLPRGQGQLVLVIDDEAAVREVTRRTLEAHGYRVLLAAGGAEGVAAYARHQLEIAVVITDMMMPLMDGAATMAALRGINPDVRIVAASGLPEDARVKEAGEAGAAYFLAKPFTAETLLGVLQQALLP